MKIYIVDLTGKSTELEVSPCDKVKDVKILFQDKVGVPSYEQRLIFRGRQLEDIFELSFYNIQRESLLNLTYILRPRPFSKNK